MKQKRIPERSILYKNGNGEASRFRYIWWSFTFILMLVLMYISHVDENMYQNTCTDILIILNIFIISVSCYIDMYNYKKSKKLFEVAYIDPVTLFGNEAYFKENATTFLKYRVEDKYIVSIDINKFRVLNNIYGYKFASKILKALAENLKIILPSDNIISRLSNDEFATIFTFSDDIKILLNKIFHEASNVEVEDKHLHLNLAIGVYKIKKEDKDINKVLDKAIFARAEIKGLYNENYYIFDEIIENKLIEEQKIESSMEEALENNEFKVVYQPKVTAVNEKAIGAEALVRWYKDGEMIPPSKFIPLFEKNKFIVKLDLYVFEQVCKDMNSWQKEYGFTPNIGINISKIHFIDENFIKEYVKITDKYNIERNKIDLEITESATIYEKIDTIKILENIKKQGFTIAIDDFGTGYSSLSMIQNMPIDSIKIDKVFIDEADLNSKHNIINYIIVIAKQLRVKTVVEGIETEEQVNFVRKLGGDIIQGYYYSKPLSKEDFSEYFKRYK